MNSLVEDALLESLDFFDPVVGALQRAIEGLLLLDEDQSLF